MRRTPRSFGGGGWRSGGGGLAALAAFAAFRQGGEVEKVADGVGEGGVGSEDLTFLSLGLQIRF